MSGELKPECPFCGGRRLTRIEDGNGCHWTKCNDCGACGPVEHEGGDRITWESRITLRAINASPGVDARSAAEEIREAVVGLSWANDGDFVPAVAAIIAKHTPTPSAPPDGWDAAATLVTLRTAIETLTDLGYKGIAARLIGLRDQIALKRGDTPAAGEREA